MSPPYHLAVAGEFPPPSIAGASPEPFPASKRTAAAGRHRRRHIPRANPTGRAPSPSRAARACLRRASPGPRTAKLHAPDVGAAALPPSTAARSPAVPSLHPTTPTRRKWRASSGQARRCRSERWHRPPGSDPLPSSTPALPRAAALLAGSCFYAPDLKAGCGRLPPRPTDPVRFCWR